MLDLKFIRNNPELVQKAIKDKGIKDLSLDEFLSLDKERLNLLQRLEEQRNLRNQLSKDIALIEDPQERQKLIDEAGFVKEKVQKLEKEYDEIEQRHREIWMRIPNVHSPEMPIGKSEEDNEVIKVWLPEKGYLDISAGTKYFDISYMPLDKHFVYKDHVDLGEILDVIDIKQSAVVSGARFSYIKSEAVLLQYALSQILRTELLKRGFQPIIPPLLVRESALFGTSHFPEGYNDAYKIDSKNVEEQNELYLVGSSEPANFAYFMDKTLPEEELPVKLFAQTTCFRSEAGSWGKDVRGIKRVHQFDKLEMNAICKPENSRGIFDEFLSINEWLLQQLKLPYRVVNKCTGDSGYNASYLQYDVEVWRPGEKEFMEVGTDTMTTDYQARSLNIKYKSGEDTEYVHTVNDTGCAMGRMIIAILENYQNEDNSVSVPDILHSYMEMEKILPKLHL
jgi:seryl-tRNA synthetase